MRVIFDDIAKKKAGTPIEGFARYRNGAGSARQEYHTLRGLNFVLGVMRIPLKSNGGPATASVSRLALNCISSERKPSNATCRIVPAVSWPVIALISWPNRCLGVPSGAWLTVAMPRRTMSAAKVSRHPAQKRRPERLA
jgi:hypothetical protein